MLRNMYDLGTVSKLVMKVFETITFESKNLKIQIFGITGGIWKNQNCTQINQRF